MTYYRYGTRDSISNAAIVLRFADRENVDLNNLLKTAFFKEEKIDCDWIYSVEIQSAEFKGNGKNNVMAEAEDWVIEQFNRILNTLKPAFPPLSDVELKIDTDQWERDGDPDVETCELPFITLGSTCWPDAEAKPWISLDDGEICGKELVSAEFKMETQQEVIIEIDKWAQEYFTTIVNQLRQLYPNIDQQIIEKLKNKF